MPSDAGVDAQGWIDLANFSVGIQSGWHSMGGDEEAKDGAAQIAGTWGCVASPNGGLEPAPAIVVTQQLLLDGGDGLASTYTDAGIPGTVRIHDMRIQPMWNGVIIDGNYVDGDATLAGVNTDAVMLAVEYFSNANIGVAGADALGRKHVWYLYNEMANILSSLSSSGATPLLTDQLSTQFMWAHIAMIYSSYGTAPDPTKPGSPFAAWLWATQFVDGTPSVPTPAIDTTVTYFPNPFTNTQPNGGPQPEASPIAGYGWTTFYKMVSHNDRLVLTSALIPTSGYSVNWMQFGLGETKTDDTLFFHGINNVQDVTATNIVQLTSDVIDGVGAIISGPANQLFIVRNHDGGLIITGSMENPTIDRFPGVEPVGGYVNNPCVTPLGVVYGAAGGVFVWPGGDHATQLGHGLEGKFWLTEGQWRSGDPIVDLQGRERRQPHTPCGTFAYRYPFVYCPNNYVFDTRTGGWFRLCQPEVTASTVGAARTSGMTFGHFGIGYTGLVYAAPTESRRNIDSHSYDAYNADLAYAVFDPDQAAGEWMWTSQPLVRGRNRQLKVREVDMVASGTGTIDVTISGINGASSTKTFTFTGEVQMKRLNFNIDAYDATVSLHATGTNMRLHRMSVGYRETRSTNHT